MKDKETNKVIVLGHRGTGGQQGYIYSVGGVSPTVCACTYKDPIKIVVVKKRENYEREYDNRDR